MAGLPCAQHADAPAAFGCESCGRLLCTQCVQEGHRLLFCRVCGERALPLDVRESATTTGRRRAEKRAVAARYGWLDAFAYPLRGHGAYALWSYIAAITLFVIFEELFEYGGCLTGLPRLMIACLVPPFLFDIARTTAAGDNELPDWPEWDFWGILKKLALAWAVGFVSLLPAGGLLAAAGCGFGDLIAGAGSLLACLLLLGIGLVVAMMLWLLAFGSTAAYETPWLFFRLDLHARAGWAVGPDLLIATLLNGLLLAVVPGLSVVLTVLVHPVASGIVSPALTLYMLLLSAHLAGVIFRRHPDALDAIYVGRPVG
jgi:hypothetical protein